MTKEFHLKSWRVVPGGGKDKAGNPRGFSIERRKGGRWTSQWFRTDFDEAVQIVKDTVYLGKSPR